MASMVAERTHEIGVRMAVGATEWDVLWKVLSRALLLAGLGVAAGVMAATAGTRLLSSQLFGIKPNDSLTLVSVILLLLCAALVAAWLPERRAAKIDPASALRRE